MTDSPEQAAFANIVGHAVEPVPEASPLEAENSRAL